jgi:hypothetical protein
MRPLDVQVQLGQRVERSDGMAFDELLGPGGA